MKINRKLFLISIVVIIFSISCGSDDSGGGGTEIDENNEYTSYSHTITIDGSLSEWTTDEKFATSTNNLTAYISWDKTYIYIALSGNEIASNSDQKWLCIYIGGTGGTQTGKSYNSQTPDIPFDALYHIQWCTDNSTLKTFKYNGSWQDEGWDFTNDTCLNDDKFEIRIPRADIGSPSNTLKLHINMLDETNLAEFSYGAVPSDSFTDSFDPDFSKYFDFDLTSEDVPIDYLSSSSRNLL